MTEAEARKLLAAVKHASDATKRAHSEMMTASTERGEAVKSALEAGIPRAQIAEAAGTDRNNLYRIAGHK